MSRLTLISLGFFLASWFLTIVTTPWFTRIARRLKMIDEPGEEKIHTEEVPQVGGAAIFGAVGLTVSLGTLLVPVLRTSLVLEPSFYGAIALGALLTFGVGLWEDIKGVPVWIRLVVQTLAAFIVIYGGGLSMEKLAFPFIGPVELGVFAVPLTLLWIVGITNALNIIDGLDGLAGGVAFLACFGLYIVAFLNQNPLAMVSLAILAGACLGFLKYNSHPADIFLGDSGALLLGFLLACISLDTSMQRSTTLALIIPMQMLAVPLIDTLYAMGRRLIEQLFSDEETSLNTLASMFESDRQHIHHILLEVGFSHPKAVLVLYMLSAVVVLFGLLSAFTMNDRISLLLLLVGFIGFIIIRHFGHLLPFIRRWKEKQ
jgi:UDP-GlcNAc:undecaprenyl-phosphate GlcNAc-1-phosphate transferase